MKFVGKLFAIERCVCGCFVMLLQYLDSDWRTKREKIEEEVEEVDWSKGLGKGVDVPEYLWWKKGANIRLRTLSKRDTELFIKDVWKAKKIVDAMKKDKTDIHKFIMQYCQKKFGNFQNVIVENMASIMSAIEVHKEDADIEMFGAILAGKLEESVYTAQVMPRLKVALFWQLFVYMRNTFRFTRVFVAILFVSRGYLLQYFLFHAGICCSLTRAML